tara:strand:+ start:609 stop:1181 length:573 start_codon:yes stop_codon:yes gene_type:complete
MKKTDNDFLASKLALRRFMLDRFHADGDIRVFDCCQGDGVVWSELRKDFDLQKYWGVDVKKRRGRLKVDSKRVVAQPGLNCNVVDIDTYGMPWDHWLNLFPNITEPTTVFLTIGLITMGGGSALSKTIRNFMQFPKDWPLSPVFTPEIVTQSVQRFLALTNDRGFKVVEAYESDKGRSARYIGCRIDVAT